MMTDCVHPAACCIFRCVIFLNILTTCYVVIITLILLALVGDVHPNPGPDHNSKYLTICHANVRSMQSQEKLDEIYYMAETYSRDVITISETWLSSVINDETLSIPGYQPFVRQDRLSHAGGIAVYVRNHIAFSRHPELEMSNVKCI